MIKTHACLILCWTLVGCHNPMGPGAGNLSVQGSGKSGAVLHGQYETAVYRYLGTTSAEVLLVEGSLEKPTQVIHVQMFWKPLAGRTPFDRHATNATVRYLNFTGRGAGLYRGGGFLFPKTPLGENIFEGELRDATLRLSENTETYAQQADGKILGQQVLARGTFFARRDDIAVERLLRKLRLHFDAHLRRQRVSDRTGSAHSRRDG